MSTQETQPTMPEGMVEVTKDRFFELLKADPRDIMPTAQWPYFTPWRVVQTGVMWGWSSHGYKTPFHSPARVYAVRREVAA